MCLRILCPYVTIRVCTGVTVALGGIHEALFAFVSVLSAELIGYDVMVVVHPARLGRSSLRVGAHGPKSGGEAKTAAAS